MTAEQRVILEVVDVLAVRVECSKCGAAVVIKPTEWKDAPFECPGCKSMWDLPHVPGQEFSPLQHFGLGLRRLSEQLKVAGKAEMPYRVKAEIRDPLAK